MLKEGKNVIAFLLFTVVLQIVQCQIQNQYSSSNSFNSGSNLQQNQYNLRQSQQNFQQHQYTSPNNNYKYPYHTQQKSNINNRMHGDEPSSTDDLTTRPPIQTSKPNRIQDIQPTAVPSRFDDINSRKISWDPEQAKSTEEFSLKLFAFLEYLQEENIMISPYSIHTLLVMIAEGAGGKTYEQLKETLGLYTPMRTRDYHQYINIALNKSGSDISLQKFTALIGDQNRPVEREYEDIVEKIYDADYIPVQFNDVEKTLRQINSEVSKKTNGQIKEALTRDELFRAQLILLSGVHFKGNWKYVFNTTSTRRSSFYDYKQERILGEVNMMFNRGPFAYTAIQDIGAYILELPYASISQQTTNKNDESSTYYLDRIAMIVLLPKRGLELFQLIDNVNKYGMERLFKELKKVKEEYDDDEVEVHLPKFEIETSINLVESLQNMNITDLFEQSLANLSRINPNYFISSILHKTKIRVDERGTEASAITTSIFANKATPPVFNANRPFIFFIVDKGTRSILFSGTYKNPTVF